ncbi:MAG TPA: hypothetical protein VG713_01205, partial [Pirellulales bacterium]|nr:hypothetical protein [Pirellulales bacterium]
MSNEKKVGLVVIGVLVITLVIVAVVRLRSRYHGSSEPVAGESVTRHTDPAERPKLATVGSSMLDRLAAEPSRVQLAVAESESPAEAQAPSPFNAPTDARSASQEPANLTEAAPGVPAYAAALSSVGDRYASAAEPSPPTHAVAASGPMVSSDPSAGADPFHQHAPLAEAAAEPSPTALQPANEAVQLMPNPADTATMAPSNAEPANDNRPAGATLLGVEPDTAVHAGIHGNEPQQAA